PVIAHLLARPRFRRLPFTMLRFLRTGQVESQSRRKLRDLLILLLRCAIIVLIAMLFARPLLHVSRNPDQARSAFYLGLDNSMSMAYSDADGSYFDRMADEAADYIRSAEAGPGEPMFNICALASGSWSQGLSKEQALAEIAALKVEPASAGIDSFLSGLIQSRRAHRLGDNIFAIVVSDFTPNMLKQFIAAAETVPVDKMDHRRIISATPVNNAAVIDAHLVGLADGKLTINATVANYGRAEQSRRLTAAAMEYRSAPMEINVPANQWQVYQVQIDLGDAAMEQLFLPVELNLSGGDGLKEDDTFYLAVSVPGENTVNVLLAGDSATDMFLVKTAMDALSRMSPYDKLNIKHVSTGELNPPNLSWADVLVCSTISKQLSDLAASVQSFVQAGGRFVSFVSERIDSEAARQLWRRDVLPVQPGNCFHERMYPQPEPCDNRAFGMDKVAAKSLTNYRIDKILLKGYLECKPHADSRCLWRLQNGAGFIYSKRHGNGTSILVNTSADGSLGMLTKSNASVAFCRYLLGAGSRVCQYSFTCDEPVELAVADSSRSSEYRIETCDGSRLRAAASDSSLVVPDPGGIGWVKTLGEPAVYAGVNLPNGETDMTEPEAAEVNDIISRVIPERAEKEVARAAALDDTERKPLWKFFAWAIIVLLLIEPLAANRLKR
ncbi:MAG: BatA domain-containing protein, partial [Planctomycetota bacterium]